MIVKSYQVQKNKSDFFKCNLFLLYGENVGLKKDIKRLIKSSINEKDKESIEDIFLDCDNDSLLIKVIQEGGIACHTGRKSCFYNRINMETNQIEINEKVVKDPKEIYKDKK